jgi:hypothetical protein
LSLSGLIKKHKLVLFIVSLLLAGGLVLVLAYSFAGSGSGPAYDWRKGEIVENYKTFTSMPEGWDFVTFTSVYEDDSAKEVGFWMPIGNPAVGSRELRLGDSGDDVRALQASLNLIDSDDTNDQYYFKPLNITGNFDAQTQEAVKKLQPYFGLDQTGTADMDFQTDLYDQIGTPDK